LFNLQPHSAATWDYTINCVSIESELRLAPEMGDGIDAITVGREKFLKSHPFIIVKVLLDQHSHSRLDRA
jgi:hypothetical protein